MPADVKRPRARPGWAACLRLTLGCAWLAGCAEAPAPAPGDYSRMDGDGCGDSLSECVDSQTLWNCHKRVWERVDCEELCRGRGGVVGCLASTSAAHGARCWCAEDAAACVPEDARCVSDSEIEVCQAETLRFEPLSCDELCAALEPPHVATGCSFGACTCTTEGTPCDPGSPPHCEYDAIATCEGGLWVLKFCGGSCPPGDNACNPFAPGGAACGCD